MPLYEFECGWCEARLSEFHRMNKVPAGPRKCPSCGRKKLSRVFSLVTPDTAKTIKTFGQQAERNAKAVGREGMDFMVREDKRRRWEAVTEKQKERAAKRGVEPTILPKTFEDAPPDPGLAKHVDKATGGMKIGGDL